MQLAAAPGMMRANIVREAVKAKSRIDTGGKTAFFLHQKAFRPFANKRLVRQAGVSWTGESVLSKQNHEPRESVRVNPGHNP